MKENYVGKINKMGKVANVIVNISRVFVTIGIVVVIMALAIFAILPKDLCKINVSGTAAIEVDLSEFDIKFSESYKDDIVKGFTDSMDIEINNIEYVGSEVEVDEDTIAMSASADTYTIYIKNLWVMMLAALIHLILTLVTLIFAGKLSKAFRDCENPFENNVINNMQKLAYSLIPWGLLGSITESLSQTAFTNNVDIVVGVDLGIVFIILIILCLTYVFKYGAMLQQESDETL